LSHDEMTRDEKSPNRSKIQQRNGSVSDRWIVCLCAMK